MNIPKITGTSLRTGTWIEANTLSEWLRLEREADATTIEAPPRLIAVLDADAPARERLSVPTMPRGVIPPAVEASA